MRILSYSRTCSLGYINLSTAFDALVIFSALHMGQCRNWNHSRMDFVFLTFLAQINVGDQRASQMAINSNKTGCLFVLLWIEDGAQVVIM